MWNDLAVSSFLTEWTKHIWETPKTNTLKKPLMSCMLPTDGPFFMIFLQMKSCTSFESTYLKTVYQKFRGYIRLYQLASVHRLVWMPSNAFKLHTDLKQLLPSNQSRNRREKGNNKSIHYIEFGKVFLLR